MAPVIPECGIFSTPRREPHLRVLSGGVQFPPTPATPTLARLTLPSPPNSQKALFSPPTPSTSGTNLGFYNSPKSPGVYKPVKAPSSAPPPRVQSVAMTGGRKKAGGLNKGVGHAIKKPKPRVVEAKQKKQKIEENARKLKERAPRTLPIGVPSSPLNQARLSSKNGDVSLNQKVGKSFAKKNIGRLVEESLDQYLQQSKISKEINEVSALPSVPTNPRPAPTRVPSPIKKTPQTRTRAPSPTKKTPQTSTRSSSPTKKTPQTSTRAPSPTKKTPQTRPRTVSPRKRVSISTSTLSKKPLDTGGELQDMELIMMEWDDGEEDKSVTKCSSPRRLNGLLTPTRRSPRKQVDCGSPVRRSPRKQATEAHTQHQESPRRPREAATPSKTLTTDALRLGDISASPTRRSPRKQAAEAHTQHLESPRRPREAATPSKTLTTDALRLGDVSASPTRRSPRKLERQTPVKRGKEEDDELDVPESPSKKVKYFPIFYPTTRLSDCKFPRSKTERSDKRFAAEMDDAQMMIDAGQKEFGASQCPTCGVVFELGNPQDAASHRDYHEHLFKALKYTGWKKERLAREPDHLGGRVVVVAGPDPQLWWQKVEEVRQVVDNELGFSENSIRTREHTKVFLYVLERRVVGCLIAEKIDKAYRVIPLEARMEDSGRLLCCSQVASRVWVGISRVWVLRARRGKGIAATLVDAMRQGMIDNHILTKDQFAFSDPTEAGLHFAEKYMGRPDFLVYRREF
ncbi:N-acetyltransferase ESCO2 [Chionoecetes opilio]|uniref:N-acetyltransferase ESCO2 n=1 Tax=Chionoecetes opilio TaxID=41210 RepID=A0A8J4YJP6_CHIOP|nr:N-acetyltransferase ESCO2 [Chionoecetes opilio]